MSSYFGRIRQVLSGMVDSPGGMLIAKLRRLVQSQSAAASGSYGFVVLARPRTLIQEVTVPPPLGDAGAHEQRRGITPAASGRF